MASNRFERRHLAAEIGVPLGRPCTIAKFGTYDRRTREGDTRVFAMWRIKAQTLGTGLEITRGFRAEGCIKRALVEYGIGRESWSRLRYQLKRDGVLS